MQGLFNNCPRCCNLLFYSPESSVIVYMTTTILPLSNLWSDRMRRPCKRRNAMKSDYTPGFLRTCSHSKSRRRRRTTSMACSSRTSALRARSKINPLNGLKCGFFPLWHKSIRLVQVSDYCQRPDSHARVNGLAAWESVSLRCLGL